MTGRRLGLVLVMVAGLAGCRAGAGRWKLFGDRTERVWRWTILCLEARDPQRRENCEALAEGLRRRPELDERAVRVVHEPEVSRIYYGRYRGDYDERAGRYRPERRCVQDCRFIRGLWMGNVQPFLYARPVARPGGQVGPPEWDLRRAPGVYSLQICYCIDKPGFPDRRVGAVEIVRKLREEGEEAYYYHGPTKSLVCVGSFDESAVIEDGRGGRRYREDVIALQNRREDFKYNSEWLQKVYHRRARGPRMAEPSFLVRIPRGPERVE